jgi:hypothetical protein
MLSSVRLQSGLGCFNDPLGVISVNFPGAELSAAASDARGADPVCGCPFP